MDVEPFSAGDIEPDDHVGGKFLVGGDDFITGVPVQTEGDVGECFGGVSGEGHFIGLATDQVGAGGSRLLKNVF